MGLDITAYEHATLTPPHPKNDDCWDREDHHVFAFIIHGSFTQSAAGLTLDRCYAVSDKKVDFRAGSYTGYSHWRDQLARNALGVESSSAVAHNLDRWRDRPFFELIWFADNEGTIGPVAAAHLATDFAEHRAQMLPLFDSDYDREKYDTWAEALTLAADTGLVQFH